MMESTNLIIAFVWIFVLVVSVMLFWVGESSVAGVGGPFIAAFALFLVAIVSSAFLLQTTKK
jgi:hypothetical protein